MKSDVVMSRNEARVALPVTHWRPVVQALQLRPDQVQLQLTEGASDTTFHVHVSSFRACALRWA